MLMATAHSVCLLVDAVILVVKVGCIVVLHGRVVASCSIHRSSNHHLNPGQDLQLEGQTEAGASCLFLANPSLVQSGLSVLHG